MEQPPATAGIVMANWYWKVVRQFVSERFGISLSRSSCLNWLHRLGFAFKRPKKRRLKADESKRETFVAEYAVLWEEAQRTGARIFFADEAHFRADAELRGKWVLKGKPALVDSSSPRYGEKASYYSAVCLETGEVEWMELEGNSNSGTSVAFLTQLKEKHPGPLRVSWDNAPAHRGEAVREYLRTPELELRLVNLPGYSPDFNADEAVWGWAREEVTGNLCLGSRAAVQERVGKFLAGLSSRKDEVRRRCRTVLQSRAETLPPRFPAPGKCTSHLGFGLVSARIYRRALSSEAVATVNRTVASGLERHRGVLAALGANDRVHFPTASIEAVVVALGSLGLAAGRTTLGLVGVALFSVVRLVISGEDEGLAALVTGEGSVRVSHSRPLFIR